MTKKKFLCILLALVVVCCMCVACGNQDNTDDTTDTTTPTGTTEASVIKIGGIGPVTGSAAVYGSSVKAGMEIAVEEVNALGGAIQFDLNFQDDEHDAEKSVNAYHNLKDWNAQILVGSVTTSPCIAVAAETYADRMFQLTPSASSPDVLTDKDNVFQLCFSDPSQGITSAEYIYNNELATKVAAIYNNGDAYSTGIYDAFKARADELGLEVVYSGTFPDDTTTDFSVQLTAAKDAGAELIFLPIYYTPASLIMQQAKDMNYEPIFFGVDGMDGILTLEGFDVTLAEGVMLLTPFNAWDDDEKVVSFVTKYEKKYGSTPNQFAADGYDCVWALYNACVANNITAEMTASEICEILIDAFTGGFTYSGLTGTDMTWSETGEVSKLPVVRIIQDGVYVDL